jgi:hypothetical protein
MSLKRGRPPKRWEDETEMSTEPQGKSESEVIDESFPYQVGQICADVKIVEIKPGVDRCIGFVYVKRDKHGAIISIAHQPKEGDTKLTYFHEWEETVHWMTLSDFQSFIKAQLESGKFVSEGI